MFQKFTFSWGHGFRFLTLVPSPLGPVEPEQLDALEEAIASEEGAADEEFLTETLEQLQLDEVALISLIENLPILQEELTNALNRRAEVYSAGELALSELQNGAGEDEEPPAEEQN